MHGSSGSNSVAVDPPAAPVGNDATGLTQLISACLAAAGCVAADEEAGDLVAAVEADAADVSRLENWVHRRQRGEPLAWITGHQEFCGHRIRVEPHVYVPRRQTEELARRAAGHLPVGSTTWAADLCTGAGAVAVHLMATRRTARVVGVDVDPRAVACARSNGVPAVLADLCVDDPPLVPGVFDVVTAVAPYVPTGALHLLPSDVRHYEPHRALDGGADGLDLVRRLVERASRLLRPGGWLLLELGGEQHVAIAPILTAIGFHRVETWCDQDGDLRGVAAQLAPERPSGVRGDEESMCIVTGQ